MKLTIKNLDINYYEKKILNNINLDINEKEIVSIIGPNGSGKSTLIKAMSRCIKPSKGNIYLDKIDIMKINTKDLAKKLAVLPQIKKVASDISIEELVSFGRYPHLKFGKRMSEKDREIVNWAIEKTGLENMKYRVVETLSGGEAQRAWIAMALAQKPKILLLDEPTTFLDISYQIEILELVKELNETIGITVVMVLHDLNQASRYSDKIAVVNKGNLCSFDIPKNVINTTILKEVFKIDADIYQDKINGGFYFVPKKYK